jgi:hypothetical protein
MQKLGHDGSIKLNDRLVEHVARQLAQHFIHSAAYETADMRYVFPGG